MSSESEHSHLLFSDLQHQSSSHDLQFISQLHEKYGIPLIQLEHIYLSSKSLRSNISEDSTELDYGQKLTLNHNILKEMISIIDNRQAIKSIAPSESRPVKRNTFNIPTQQIDSKLKEVKSRLEELISFIGQEQQKSEPIEIKKVVNLSDINQASYFEASLQYSKDLEPTKEKNMIVIDRNKLEQAKEVTSQFMLAPNSLDASRASREREPHLKSSLDRISEVQSGETIQKQEQKNQEQKTPKISRNQSISVNHSSQHFQNPGELDETGKIILSTINKKIAKISTVSDIGGSKQTIPSAPNGTDLKNEVKRSRFWKNHSNTNAGKLETLPHNFAISNQVIEEPKAFQRSRFRFDHFNNGFTFKSLESIDRIQRQIHHDQSQRQSHKMQSQESLNSPKTHINRHKNQKTVIKPNNTASSPSISKFERTHTHDLVKKNMNGSMIVSPHHTTKFSINGIKNLPSARQYTQQYINRPRQLRNQFGNSQYQTVQDQAYLRTASYMPSQNAIRRPQSVPQLPQQRQPYPYHPHIHRNGFKNQQYLNISSPRIIPPNHNLQQQEQSISKHHRPHSPEALEPQTLFNPYIIANKVRVDPRHQSVVYQNIYEEILDDSDISSQKSSKALPLSMHNLPVRAQANPSANESRLKKKGIGLTRVHHFYNKT